MLGRLIKRRREPAVEVERAALRGVLADPIFELLPLKSIGDQIAHLTLDELRTVDEGLELVLDLG